MTARLVILLAIVGVAVSACSEQGAVSAGTGSSTHGGGGSESGGTGGSVASGGAGQTVGGAAGNGGDAGQAASGGTGNVGGSSPSGGLSGSGGAQAGAGFGTGGSGVTGGAAGNPGGEAGLGSGGSGQAGRGAGNGGQAGTAGGRSISFGTLLDAQAVKNSAQALAASLANPNGPGWRAKGDQRRTYRFPETNGDEPYRIYVPTTWDGSASLPLAMFLHGAGSNESTYLDQNNKQMINLAEQHGYLLVSPRGVSGAYGNFLRLTAPFGDEAGAAELMAAVTADSERTNQLSEKDVINVLELVLSEYPVDRASMFLFGHSMGSGGTWYIGGKYAGYWKGLAPMSGPFVQEGGYPWEGIRNISLFVTEGTQTPSLDASRLLSEWLTENGFQSEYEEVNADHGGMVTLVLPDIFDFFDRARSR